MEEQTKITVKFIRREGEVIALFVDEFYNEQLYGKSLIGSYMHIGQHGSASRNLVHAKRATGRDVDELYNELVSIGYAPIFSHLINKKGRNEIKSNNK